MKIALYVDMYSPHQAPLAEALARRVGAANFRYVAKMDVTDDRRALGWQTAVAECPFTISRDSESADWLETSDILLLTLREQADLFARRRARGLTTYYMSERWFKPPRGILRLLHPGYFKMCRAFVKQIKAGAVTFLPKGVWAARDMARLVGLFSGDIRCLFRAPRLDFVAEPLGAIRGYPWMKMWGYFVAPAAAIPFPAQEADEPSARALRVLWVGRLLRLKRVGTLFKAVYAAQTQCPIALTLVGQGPEQARLARLDRRLAKKYGVVSPISYHAAVPVAEVRSFMRVHDMYVLPSNGYEGWGAVVSEALEEGLEVFGTYEAGSSATMLPRENLFHAGDWKPLRDMLTSYAQTRERHCRGIEKWDARTAAHNLLNGTLFPQTDKNQEIARCV